MVSLIILVNLAIYVFIYPLFLCISSSIVHIHWIPVSLSIHILILIRIGVHEFWGHKSPRVVHCRRPQLWCTSLVDSRFPIMFVIVMRGLAWHDGIRPYVSGLRYLEKVWIYSKVYTTWSASAKMAAPLVLARSRSPKRRSSARISFRLKSSNFFGCISDCRWLKYHMTAMSCTMM